MEKLLKPTQFSVDPESSSAEQDWQHWLRLFTNFSNSIEEIGDTEKLNLLFAHISSKVFQYITECTTYASAISKLTDIYVKAKNEVFARHLLSTRKQQNGESLDEFLLILKKLSRDCNYRNVTAEVYKSECVRDAFISGLQSNNIRQRLLENKTLTLEDAFEQARALDIAHKNSQYYQPLPIQAAAVEVSKNEVSKNDSLVTAESSTTSAAVQFSNQKCFFCGGKRHPRDSCPAKSVTCNKCNKLGHFGKVCKSTKSIVASIQPELPLQPRLASSFSGDSSKVVISVTLNDNIQAKALLDTGSTESFISQKMVHAHKLNTSPSSGGVTLAVKNCTSSVQGYCYLNLKIKSHSYNNCKFNVLNDLVADLIIGEDIMKLHESLNLYFGGSRPPLQLCSLKPMDVPKPTPFSRVPDNVKPIAVRSRKYTQENEQFIKEETTRMLDAGIIRPSKSSWRAQVVVTQQKKKRMVIDYAQTINKYTPLDAYPIPNIDELIQKVAKHIVYSALDLKSAYHQVEISECDRHYTGFEAAGKLYEFNRLPFGITNAVPEFQRAIDNVIETNDCQATYPYIDNIIIGGDSQADHDKKLAHFLQVAEKYNLTLNENECVFSTKCIKVLGYCIEEGAISPDPDRVQPLLDLPVPKNKSSLQRVIGMFAYYARWIPRYSDNIRPLLKADSFPLTEEQVKAFNTLKKLLADSSLQSIDSTLPFTLETDASDFALSAVLSQEGRPVAYHARTFNQNEMGHPIVEKEAEAVIEAVDKWKHFLICKPFKLITDQQALSFMFDKTNHSKIKNTKINRWKYDLAQYQYTVQFRPGKENLGADTLSRAYCAATNSDAYCAVTNSDTLLQIHKDLCHPGVTRMSHFVRSKHLPYSVEEVKQMTANCPDCSRIKPRFFKPQNPPLIKSTAPWERLNIDFKGPLDSKTSNKYILTVVDEFSRFVFAFPCKDVGTTSVINCMNSLFSLFGMPAFVHSDRGSSLISSELKSYFLSRGVGSSFTTRYNPQGNGQCESYNGIVWRATKLCLASKNLELNCWEHVLPDVLHSLRSLLCTSTGCTPHERFFNFSRRSSSGLSIPTWLSEAKTVLLRRHARKSKSEPLVDEVEILQCNPNYALVRNENGREMTVSLRDLAPAPALNTSLENSESSPNDQSPHSSLPNNIHLPGEIQTTNNEKNTSTDIDTVPEIENVLRRSKRIIKPPEKLDL